MLVIGCSKTVQRPRDRRFDDRYTDASVKPFPNTVNTSPPTHKPWFTHYILKMFRQHIFRKKLQV